MKRFLYFLIGLWEDSPFTYIIFFGILILALQKPAYAVLSSFLSKDFAIMITASSFLAIIGLLGVVMIIRKIAPITLIPIRGLPAIVIGLILALVGFGGIVWGVIRTIFSLRVP